MAPYPSLCRSSHEELRDAHKVTADHVHQRGGRGVMDCYSSASCYQRENSGLRGLPWGATNCSLVTGQYQALRASWGLGRYPNVTLRLAARFKTRSMDGRATLVLADLPAFLAALWSPSAHVVSLGMVRLAVRGDERLTCIG